jgi:hypothetical protein
MSMVFICAEHGPYNGDFTYCPTCGKKGSGDPFGEDPEGRALSALVAIYSRMPAPPKQAELRVVDSVTTYGACEEPIPKKSFLDRFVDKIFGL